VGDLQADEPHPTEGRRRTRRPLIVREDVIAAALALLDEGGYGHLSMRNLCRRLGVSLPTVYTAAHSKESVVELAGGRGLHRWVGAFAGGTIDGAVTAMAGRPWLFELVRLEPRLARAALGQLSDEAVAAVAALGSSATPPAVAGPGVAGPGVAGPGVAEPDVAMAAREETASRPARIDAAMLVWMTLELAHRLMETGVTGGDEQTAALAASVLAAVAPWVVAG
jgi:AcrR family transcriptional regulator